MYNILKSKIKIRILSLGIQNDNEARGGVVSVDDNLLISKYRTIVFVGDGEIPSVGRATVKIYLFLMMIIWKLRYKSFGELLR